MTRNTIGHLIASAFWCGEMLVGLAAPSAQAQVEWVRQFGTVGVDRGYGVSADRLGNVYISGVTTPMGLPYGPNDAFVRKYDAAGNLQWARQPGTGEPDTSWGVSSDGLGNVYISGSTSGSIGKPNAGSVDAFVEKYTAAGDVQWTRQLGTVTDEYGYGVSADRLGNVYISGATYGSLGGPNADNFDAFISKFDEADNQINNADQHEHRNDGGQYRVFGHKFAKQW